MISAGGKNPLEQYAALFTLTASDISPRRYSSGQNEHGTVSFYRNSPNLIYYLFPSSLQFTD